MVMSTDKHEAQLRGQYAVGRSNGDDCTLFHRLLRNWKEKQSKTKKENKVLSPLSFFPGPSVTAGRGSDFRKSCPLPLHRSWSHHYQHTYLASRSPVTSSGSAALLWQPRLSLLENELLHLYLDGKELKNEMLFLLLLVFPLFPPN